MTRDQDIYRNPEIFEPDRFLDPQVPPSPVFGWGRRRCPGIRIAEDTLFIVIASVLSTFDVTGATRTGSNNPLSPPKLVSSLLLRPDVFQLTLLPRSEKHKSLVLGEL